MRTIDELPIDLTLYDSVMHGSAQIKAVKRQFGPTWRRSIRGVGGFWIGTCEYENGSRDDYLEMFLEGMMRELRETWGGLYMWQGFLGKASLVLDGLQYEREWPPINSVKCIYTRLGDNQFTNGSAESGAWAAYGSPSTLEQSTTWVNDGTYSCHIIMSVANQLTNGGAESGAWTAYNTPSTLEQSTTWKSEGTYSCHIVADSADDGAKIQDGIAISASTEYEFRMDYDLISGEWTVEIYRQTGGNIVASGSITSLGQGNITVSIPDTNTFAGNIGIRVKCTTGTGQIYCDGAVFRTGADHGAIIQSGITIAANKAYEVEVATKIVSGTWTLEIYRTDIDTALGAASESTAGQRVMRAEIADTNLHAGTIGVRLYCTSDSGEIYADGAKFREAPQQAETAWYMDVDSQDEFGVSEDVLLYGGLSDAAANAKAQTHLGKNRWVRTRPPDDYLVGKVQGPDSLSLTFYGHVFTLRNRHCRSAGTDQAGTIVSTLIGESEFITAGIVSANTMQYQIDDRGPLRAWDVIEDIVLTGDASGNRWIGGVYGGRKFDYGQASTTIEYRYSKGILKTVSGVVIEPWFLRPGLVYMDDMPLGPGDISGNDMDDPRAFYMDEVEFDVAGWLKGETGLRFRRERRD